MLGINKIKIISMATMQTLFREKRKGKEEAGKESSLGVKKKNPNNRRTCLHYNKP